MVWKVSGGGMNHETRKCRTCDDELVINLNITQNTYDRKDYECNVCKQTRTTDRARRNKLEAIKYKGGSCVDCGGTFPPRVFDFHHVNPDDKEHKIASMLRSQSWENAKQELDKCVLLCANCHRIRHSEDEL